MIARRASTSPSGSLTSRLYGSENDLQQMLEFVVEARAQTSDWRYPHVGELLFNFFMVDCHLNLREHIRLWHDSEGRLVGYAILGEDPSFDCVVHPIYEWTGIEGEALAWAEGRVDELRTRDPRRWSAGMVSGARQDDPRRITFLEQHGFRYSGEFAEVNLLRSLGELLPAAVLPAGCQVRAVSAEAGEISNRAAAQREIWQPWTVGNISTEDYIRFMRLPGYDRELDVVAVAPDGVIAAYVNGWIDPVNRIGDFGPVGTRPAYRQQGYARAALRESLHRMQSRGMDWGCISTGATNTPALRLYESLGFRIMNRYLDFVHLD